MDRRAFVKGCAAVAAGLGGSVRAQVAKPATKPATKPVAQGMPKDAVKVNIPFYRGFNLLEKFTHGRKGAYREEDFAIMKEWGFNFVRLPLSYLCWTPDPARPREVDEKQLAEIDRAVELGKQYGIHCNLNFHRAPGYCVNPPKEARDLWTDESALEDCAWHWERFAERYKGYGSERVSFNLVNEPNAEVTEEQYVKVAKHLVERIQRIDPDRVIFADGARWGSRPVGELVRIGLVQSTRGYAPMQISHHKASWVNGSDTWPVPSWPLTMQDGKVWDRDRMKREYVAPFKEVEAVGGAVHVGEWGAHNRTPHEVVLRWMEDCLRNWREANWGWALWNLRGSFGVMDSGRNDVPYETYKGRKLDRKMMELLRQW